MLTVLNRTSGNLTIAGARVPRGKAHTMDDRRLVGQPELAETLIDLIAAGSIALSRNGQLLTDDQIRSLVHDSEGVVISTLNLDQEDVGGGGGLSQRVLTLVPHAAVTAQEDSRWCAVNPTWFLVGESPPNFSMIAVARVPASCTGYIELYNLNTNEIYATITVVETVPTYKSAGPFSLPEGTTRLGVRARLEGGSGYLVYGADLFINGS